MISILYIGLKTMYPSPVKHNIFSSSCYTPKFTNHVPFSAFIFTPFAFVLTLFNFNFLFIFGFSFLYFFSLPPFPNFCPKRYLLISPRGGLFSLVPDRHLSDRKIQLVGEEQWILQTSGVLPLVQIPIRFLASQEVTGFSACIALIQAYSGG